MSKYLALAATVLALHQAHAVVYVTNPFVSSFSFVGQTNSTNLSTNISTLWLIEPFVNQLEIGDVVNLTAYYYMTP